METKQVIEVDGKWIMVVNKIKPEPIDAPRLRILPDGNGRYIEHPDGFEALDVSVDWFRWLKRLLDNVPA